MLLEPALMEELVETFGERVVRVHQAVRGTITWERSTFSADGVGGCTRSVKTAPQIVILMSPARLEELVESDSFGDEVARARMRFPEPRPLCLLIWGLKSHLQGRPVAAQRVVLNEISDALQGALPRHHGWELSPVMQVVLYPLQAELDAIKEEADEALQQVVDEGIKDQMTASEPPKELKEPDA